MLSDPRNNQDTWSGWMEYPISARKARRLMKKKS